LLFQARFPSPPEKLLFQARFPSPPEKLLFHARLPRPPEKLLFQARFPSPPKSNHTLNKNFLLFSKLANVARKSLFFVRKSANYWAQSAVANSQISQVCQSANRKFKNFSPFDSEDERPLLKVRKFALY
jgi:hypothetical protein